MERRYESSTWGGGISQFIRKLNYRRPRRNSRRLRHVGKMEGWRFTIYLR